MFSEYQSKGEGDYLGESIPGFIGLEGDSPFLQLILRSWVPGQVPCHSDGSSNCEASLTSWSSSSITILRSMISSRESLSWASIMVQYRARTGRRMRLEIPFPVLGLIHFRPSNDPKISAR